MAIIVNDNFQSNSPKSLDNKYLKNGTTPYASISEANSLIPIAYRSVGLTILINLGSENVEHWYKDGTGDGNLVEKILEQDKLISITSNVNTFVTIPAGKLVTHIIVNPTSTLAALSIGTTLGGGEILASEFGNILANSDSVIEVNRYFRSSDNIYFTNVTSNTQFIIFIV